MKKINFKKIAIQSEVDVSYLQLCIVTKGTVLPKHIIMPASPLLFLVRARITQISLTFHLKHTVRTFFQKQTQCFSRLKILVDLKTGSVLTVVWIVIYYFILFVLFLFFWFQMMEFLTFVTNLKLFICFQVSIVCFLSSMRLAQWLFWVSVI